MKRIKDNNHLYSAKMVNEIIVEPVFSEVVSIKAILAVDIPRGGSSFHSFHWN